jgi:DNA-binding transcriptional ArsR family regulator
MTRQAARLNDVFRALADPTRRAILERLASGSVGTSALAKDFEMALPSFTQHLDVLEECGLVKSIKLGRIRMYKLAPQPYKPVNQWLHRQSRAWTARFDGLHRYLLDRKEKAP